MPNAIARVHRSTGDAVATLVFMRIAFWYDVAVREKRNATAQSYEDLERETACTKRQLKRAVAILRDKGLVSVTQKLFANKNVNHFTVTDFGQHTLKGAPYVTLKGLDMGTPKGSLLLQGETTASNNMEISEQTLAEGPEDGMGKISGKGKTAAELIGMATGAPKVPEKTESVQRLGQYWCEAVASVYGTFVPPLTTKQTGQLKHFMAKLPNGKAQTAMLWAIHNWVDFVKGVEEQAGVKGTPSQPVVSFLLLHAGIALELAGKTKVQKPKQEAPKNPMPAPVVEAEEKPATLEEIMAIMNGDDDA